ncbi:iron complex transport system permease protein [Alteribacillus persepolensis]|uniref:Iron complex transport system permease protein n=1 Tax=Alteribacillus persepolensis TaxID=568899 RepID=A0A1G7Z6B1_9BACI|nr:iron ABC transporter permease [Alteribacillus persepolensis]SDH03670.1 iron complex transport system permease protein [Alteribacillus persepolensis]
MKRKERSMPFLYIGLTAALLFTCFISLFIGAASLSPRVVIHVFLKVFGNAGGELTTSEHIIWSLRLPRTVLALTVGAGLAVCGVAIQALIKNPLADPYILGVSSGASLGAVLAIIVGTFSFIGSFAIPVSAFVGALSAVAVVYMLAKERFHLSITKLLLSGVAISMICSALTSLVVILNPRDEGIQTALYWMLGSLAGAEMSELWLPLMVISFGYMYLFLSYRSLNVLVTDDQTAQSVGLRIETFKIALIMLTALLTSVLVAYSGAIGFVGLMIPHVARMIVGADHRILLPVSAFIGSLFLIWADIAARTIASPEELPIGIITAVCGGPFFIWLLRKSHYTV